MIPESVHLLLVEDSATDRLMVTYQLSRISKPNFRVTQALSLEQAQQNLRADPFDVILLDLGLSDSHGLDGLLCLSQEFSAIPIVILTGDEDEEVALQAFRWGAQDYLVKGRAPAFLLKRVLLYAIERKRVDITLNQHRESLREAQRLEMMGRVAGKVAHDFNNILNTIMGFADIVLEDLAGHPSQEDLLEIKRAAERGVKLTKTVLEFSVRGSAKGQACCPDSVVTGMEGILRLLLPAGAQIETELNAAGRLIEADPTVLEEVLKSLVLNARDALRAQGAITVRTAHSIVSRNQISSALDPGDYVTLEVQDNGVGMDEATKNRMFDPFFTTRAKDGGRGLGLSKVADFVRAQKGGVQVDSQPNLGTRITLLFPEGKAESSEGAALGGRPQKTRVIVFDEHLFSQPQYADCFAERGFAISRLLLQEAARFVCDSTVRFLFLNGHDLNEELRTWAMALLSLWPDLQVVVVATHSDDDALRTLGSTELGVLWRPFSPNSLNALLRTASHSKS